MDLRKILYNFTLVKIHYFGVEVVFLRLFLPYKTQLFKIFAEKSCTERNFVYLCSPIWGVPH